MRYLIDEDLSTDIAVIGRGLGLDVVSVQEQDRRGWTDEELLTQAGIDGRCIVTANRDDFARLTDKFGREDRPHTGVLVVGGTLRWAPAARIAHALAELERTRGDFPFEYVWDFL